MIFPFGQTVKLWRVHRGYTQEGLARRAGIPRPNLSAIERGRREVSLSTLRMLALGLDVRPGVLADGVPPATPMPERWSRAVLERVADDAAGLRPARRRSERVVARQLRTLIRHRAQAAAGRRGTVRRGVRASEAAWLSLRARCAPELLRSLLQRIEKRQGSR